jgi:hypothetical protein
MLIVYDRLPTWAMLLANLPFGGVYVWTESLWQGEGYKIGEDAVFVLQLGAHIAQIFLYYGAWLVWKRVRWKPAQLQQKDQPG